MNTCPFWGLCWPAGWGLRDGSKASEKNLSRLILKLPAMIRNRARSRNLIGRSSSRRRSQEEKAPVLPLLIYWSFSSLFAYSVAGEKMPWLTVHITLAMIFKHCLGVGENHRLGRLVCVRQAARLVDPGADPDLFDQRFCSAWFLLGTQPPFQGKELAQLQATSTFLTACWAPWRAAWRSSTWRAPGRLASFGVCWCSHFSA